MPRTSVTKSPLSPAQLAARRANAIKSTGPKDTSQTKFNGLVHGMRSATIVPPPACTVPRHGRAPAGCSWCLSQFDILQGYPGTHACRLGTQRHRALHLVGKRMGDVPAGDPTAVRWFVALIGAAFGNQGETGD